MKIVAVPASNTSNFPFGVSLQSIWK